MKNYDQYTQEGLVIVGESGRNHTLSPQFRLYVLYYYRKNFGSNTDEVSDEEIIQWYMDSCEEDEDFADYIWGYIEFLADEKDFNVQEELKQFQI